MKADEFTELVLEIIKSEPEEIIKYIKNKDWDGLQNDIYYSVCSAMEG